MRELNNLQHRFDGYVPQMLEARHSYAVLCPFVEQPDGLHLLFEVRAAALRRQPGEVCFPGGMQEPGETPEVCALRETWEELGIPREEIRVFGKSDFLCSHRGFLLQPVLAAVSPAGLAALCPSPAEVAEVFTVPLRFFQETEPEVYAYTQEPVVQPDFPFAAVGVVPDYPFARGRVEVPVWHYETHPIWGITARIVRSVLRLLDPDAPR